ncbi:hypothetical protein B0O99DRAFT_220016 [Bisporella sp. PMI_857]|nr:hypothetical protein B0O99DRAFT_220016 [Bisporella sp. PMI_857]
MGKDKGKGREIDEEKDPVGADTEDRQDHDPSFLNRVTASAVGLARSALAAPNKHELDEGTIAALAGADKRQLSSSRSHPGQAESSNFAQQQSSRTSGLNPLRTTHQEQHIQQAESEFSSFLDGIPSLTHSDLEATNLVDPGEGITWGNAWANSQHYDDSQPAYTTIAVQEAQDGAEVLALLSSSSVNIDQERVFPPEPTNDDEAYNWGLSPQQVQQLRSITESLFPDHLEPHAPMPPDHPLNLIPTNESTDGNMSSPAKDAAADELYVGYEMNGQPVAGIQLWRRQWEAVLTGYTDEVWGGLLPLVKEARKEIEEVHEGEGSEEPVALRRLRGILGHLRQA